MERMTHWPLLVLGVVLLFGLLSPTGSPLLPTLPTSFQQLLHHPQDLLSASLRGLGFLDANPRAGWRLRPLSFCCAQTPESAQ